MKEYERHLIACDDKDCCDGEAKKLFKDIKERLGKDSRMVKCSTVSCLGQCKHGPVLIVYPEGVWYQAEDKKAVEKIVDKHLIGGKIAKKHVLFKMSPKASSSS